MLEKCPGSGLGREFELPNVLVALGFAVIEANWPEAFEVREECAHKEVAFVRRAKGFGVDALPNSPPQELVLLEQLEQRREQELE
jgi:hypothetical protein